MTAFPTSLRMLSRLHGLLQLAVVLAIGGWLANMAWAWFDRLIVSGAVLAFIAVAGLYGDPLWIRLRKTWVEMEVEKGSPRTAAEDHFYREHEE